MADYERKVADVMGMVRRFYADQMEAHGFGRATFELEKGVHLVASPLKADEFASEGHVRYAIGNYWKNAEDALRAAGFPTYRRGEIWVIFAETARQLPDGSLRNVTAQGAAGFESGVCLVNSTVLSASTRENLLDSRPYDGRIVPGIGPQRLVRHKSFPYYEGDSVNSLAGVFVGALAHEIGHCLNLQHCNVNDDAQNGSLMGNGFRGFRGYALPQECPNEDTRLDRANALTLRLSPFFRRPAARIRAGRPVNVTIETKPGDMKIEGGKIRFAYSAEQTDGPGIALATLENGGGNDGVSIVAWKEFNGRDRQVRGIFETARIFAGREARWRLRVFDAAGQVTESFVTLKAPDQFFAPDPKIFVAHSRVKVGASVRFQGSAGGRAVTYDWSFGDGSAGKGETAEHVFAKPGVYHVKLRATAPNGDFSESSVTLSIRPTPPPRIF
jgi:hypothetical protein